MGISRFNYLRMVSEWLACGVCLVAKVSTLVDLGREESYILSFEIPEHSSHWMVCLFAGYIFVGLDNCCGKCYLKGCALREYKNGLSGMSKGQHLAWC